MYRFSNNLTYSGATEKGRSYMVFHGENIAGYKNPSYLWKLETTRDDGARIYFCTHYGRIKVFKKPLKELNFEFLEKQLQVFSPKEIHPSMRNRPQDEALRLFPTINSEVHRKYLDFIQYLNQEFGLDKILLQQQKENHIVFSDDLGPFMIGSLEEKPYLLPELPPLYLAPRRWAQINWWIQSYFSGPYPKKDTYADVHPFYWNKLEIPENYKNETDEVISYLLISNFILSYEAWMNRSSADSLSLFMRMIQHQKIRPWQMLY